MKTCNKCGLSLGVEMFYRNRAMPDGRERNCKTCAKLRAAAYNARPEVKLAKSEYGHKWLRSLSDADREKRRERVRLFNALPVNVEIRRVAHAEWQKSDAGKNWLARCRESNPEKTVARDACNNAVKAGVLIKPRRCSICNAGGRIEGHHYLGYAPEHVLDVQWLCVPCHRRADRQSFKIRSAEKTRPCPPSSVEDWTT